MTKQCTSCEQWKPLGDFYANGSRPGYTWPTCKACKRAERAAYREAHREAINAGKVEHHRRNPHLKWRYRYEERMREAGMLALVEHFTRDDVVARYGDACFHCGGDFEELDHFPVPVRDGGPHTLAQRAPLVPGMQPKDVEADCLTADRAISTPPPADPASCRPTPNGPPAFGPTGCRNRRAGRAQPVATAPAAGSAGWGSIPDAAVLITRLARCRRREGLL